MLLMELTLSRLETRFSPILDDFAKNYRAPRGDSGPIVLLQAIDELVILRGRVVPIIFGLRSKPESLHSTA